jgi:hypothetical protein
MWKRIGYAASTGEYYNPEGKPICQSSDYYQHSQTGEYADSWYLAEIGELP